MPQRILVTGATGFVGSHLLPVLAAAFPDAAIVPGRFDVTDHPAMLAAIKADAPDACVHLAAVAAIPAAQQDPDRAWRVNLHGTLGLAHALAPRRRAAPCCFPPPPMPMAAASKPAAR